MAITLDNGRQHPLSAKVKFSLADLASGTALAAVKLPVGAQVIGGELGCTTVFNSTTSDTIAVGDTSAANAVLAATDVQATGITALTGLKEYSGGDTITVTWTSGGGTPTTGEAWLRVEYVIDGRSTDVQP